MHPHRRALTALATAAGLVTTLLTAGAFWLSYDHLHAIAGGHGLGSARAWAWPGTIDGFILVGEILMLHASLRRRVSIWGIGLTAGGSLGSIALNVSGVGGGASALDYIVAAVPPTAALVAFGALMRQVHTALDRATDTAPDAPAPGAPAPADTGFEQAASEATALAAPAPGPSALILDLAPMLPPIPEVTPDAHPAAPAPPTPARRAPGTSTATDEQLIEQARALAANGPLSLRRMQTALGIGQARAQRIRDALDTAPEENVS